MIDPLNLRGAPGTLRPERRRHLLGLVAGLLLGAVVVLVVAAPEQSLVLLALGLGGVFFAANPHWGVLIIFVLVTFRLSPTRLGPLSAAELLAAVLAVPLACQFLRDRRIWVWHVPQIRLLLGIAGVLVTATGWSLLMHPAPPAELDYTWLEPFFFGQSFFFLIYLVYFLKSPRHLVYAVIVVLLMILAAAADGMNLLEDTPGPTRAATDYFGGFAGNANRLGFLCVWGTALFWSLRFKGPRGWWRPFTVVPLLVLPVTTLMTGSRNGFIQLTLLGALILLEQHQWSPARRIRALVLMVMMALVVLIAAPSDMLTRASSFEFTAGPTTYDRIYTFGAGLAMLAEHPIFGVGPGNFPWRNRALTGFTSTPHNSFLWALTSGGPLLLILYLALFYRTYRTLRAVERWGPRGFIWLATALRFNLIILLVASCFATIWLQEPFWLLIGLSIVLARIAKVGPIIATAAPAMVGTK
jgi:O-antigen ligase